MPDPTHDTLGDHLRLLGTQTPAATLPAAEIRRRADRRRHRRHVLGAVAACGATVLCLTLPSLLHSPGPRQEAAGSATPGTPSTPASGSGASATRVTPTPVAFTVGSVRTVPIDAGAAAGILASCLGSDASRYHAVIAVRTPVASQDADGVVVAVNSAHQYVQCESKGDKGTSQDVPPTFINDRLWGVGHRIEFFDSVGEPADGGQYLWLGAGHYTPDVARITISYGDDPTQYPALMAGGAFVYSAALATGTSPLGGDQVPPTPYVHAYNATGKEIYNQKQQPTPK